MRLVSAHINPLGNFLLGLDNKYNYHGVFCWGLEQITTLIRDWRLNAVEERALVSAFDPQDAGLCAKRDPEIIHGIGAALIGKQFSTVQHVRELVSPKTTVTLMHGHVYFQIEPFEDHKREATLVFYITPEGICTLAHLRTKDQAEELLWEDWLDAHDRDIIQQAIHSLPELDRSFLHPTYVQGHLIQQLITAQMLYRSLFPDDSAARN